MSYVRFNHVFGSLLVLSGVSAFAIPEKYSKKPLPGLQAVFAPVSFPARRLGAWAHDRLNPPDLASKRSLQAVLAENDRLTNYVGSLQTQLEIERRRNAEWAPLAADVRERCMAVAVGGADAGTRESLALPPSSLQRVREGAFALYPGGVAGQVQGGGGPGGAQLRLITDAGFKVQGRFVRKDPAGGPKPVQTTQVVLLEGVGEGAMVVRAAFTWEEVQKGAVKIGDAALLEDRDWPPDLHGQRLGIVTKVEPMREQRKFAEIRVEPTTNLMMLDEVMVFTK